jgi:hypothetical protein
VSGDYSRHSYDPLKGYSAPLLQQGRVALDSDWNEWVSSVERRLRAGTVDTIGRTTVPRETADGFKIALAVANNVQSMSIGRGRMYVDGLLAENHGDTPTRFDLIEPHPSGRGPLGVLGEVFGTDTIPYLEQPFLSAADRPWLPAPAALPATNGPHLIYVDVWQREVTFVEDPGLLEPALGGVDTSTRLQTVWQVRVLPDVGAGINCQTPDAAIPGWLDLTRASAGRLSTEEIPVPQDDDPCLVPAAAGFRGLENQLYRIEMHRGGGTGGGAGGARFKWSRENASVATRVTAISAADRIVVESVGRDEFLRINEGDWIEVTDDKRELTGRSGDMCLVKSVEDATRSIVLTHPLSADLQPPGGLDTLQKRNTRLRKWDQRGRILDRNGTELANLDDAAQLADPDRRGTIPVTGALNGVQLESGILLRFDLEPNAGTFHIGDYWNFAARAAGGTFEKLDSAPPRGTHHHFARLAVVTFPASVVDCRHLWPPQFEGDTCACDVCVTAEAHNSGQLTIQMAIDSVRERGGTVCLDSGDYLVRESLGIREARSVRLVGKGSRTVLSYVGDRAALQIEFATDVDVRDISFAFGSAGDLPLAGISIANSSELVIEGCYFQELEQQGERDIAIELSGFVSNARICNNVAVCGHGFVSRAAQEEPEYLVLSDVLIAQNDLRCRQRGIDFSGSVYFLGDVRIDANFLFRCETVGLRAVLQAHNDDLPTSRVRVSRNMIAAAGNGIVIGARLFEVSGNTVVGLPGGKESTGISVVAHELDARAVMDARIVDNLVRSVSTDGIRIVAQCVNLLISRNTVEYVRRSGITFDADATAQVAHIEGNILSNLCTEEGAQDRALIGVALNNCEHLKFSGNTIRGVAVLAQNAPIFVGLAVFGCPRPQVENNDISGVGPADFVGLGIGVILLTFSSVVFNGNRIRRFDVELQQNRSQWVGVLISDLSTLARLTRTFGFTALNSGLPLHFMTAATAFRLTANFGVALAVRAGTRAMINDNTFDGFGGSEPLAMINVTDACHFQDNHVDLEDKSTADGVVQIQAGLAALVSNNRVMRLGDAPCMQISARKFTVTGNITTSMIQMNGGALPAPWNVLNV